MKAPGLDDASYDQTVFTNQLVFLDVSKAKPLSQGISLSVETPDSSPNLLHVYHGYLSVVHPGEYEFRLDPNGIGEVTLGETVVTRAGFPEANISQPVTLEADHVSYTVKLAKGCGPIRRKVLGQDWQAIAPGDLMHEVRPLMSVPNRKRGNTSYEIFGPTQVALETETPLQSAKIVSTLDGSKPKEGGTPYEQALSIDKTTQLRARLFQDGKPVGVESSAQFTLSKTPAQRLLGFWPAEKFDGKVLPNQCIGSGAASNLILPEGTKLIDDPQRGKALSLDHSSKVMMSNPAILDNELTLAYWFNTQKTGVLKIAPPKELQGAFPQDNAKRSRKILAEKGELLRRNGLTGVFFGCEPMWLAESLYQQHPDW